ncbi:hypothetical protein M422DRAFT_274249 [Sphaerobolus stellatus SS14]|uniref:Uncharacterized protein n=1 Tax=Sphaerobolus stellatus (strain SS14) TaxID=990650 RepID=A0A0C9UI67_SPHS4|nr:hypothetical protein M422DRAFT_274249 [Sphaerobolus stellatus SS14]
MAAATISAAKRQKKKKNGQIKSNQVKKVEANKKLEALEEAAANFELPSGQISFSSLPISEQTKKGAGLFGELLQLADVPQG